MGTEKREDSEYKLDEGKEMTSTLPRIPCTAISAVVPYENKSIYHGTILNGRGRVVCSQLLGTSATYGRAIGSQSPFEASALLYNARAGAASQTTW